MDNHGPWSPLIVMTLHVYSIDLRIIWIRSFSLINEGPTGARKWKWQTIIQLQDSVQKRVIYTRSRRILSFFKENFCFAFVIKPIIDYRWFHKHVLHLQKKWIELILTTIKDSQTVKTLFKWNPEVRPEVVAG